MADFGYINTKNPSTSHNLFELNYGYNFQVLYYKIVNFYFKSKTTNKLIIKLRKLITIYYRNFYYIQKLHK